MQQDNYIQKLKELEGQQAPDLSHMDEHWQQMSSLLQQPASTSASPRSPRNIMTGLIITIFVMILSGILVYFSYIEYYNSGDVQSSFAGMPTKISNLFIPESQKENIIALPTVVPTVKRSTAPVLYLPGWDDDDSGAHADDTLFTNVKINFPACSTCPSKKENVTGDGIDRRLLLENFFNEVSKQAQQFLIDNRKDTILFAKEGTAVYIPMGAFNRLDSITISLSEYYDYADMILNRLITKSDSRQLISGGMFNIQAEKNGRQISLSNGAAVKVFIPGISAKDSFQVFYAVQNNGTVNQTIDHAAIETPAINWQLSNIGIDSAIIKMFVRAVDLRDNLVGENYVWGTHKTKAVFTRSRESIYSKAELKEILKKKYGTVYDKIVVRNQWKRNLFFKKISDTEDEEYYHAVYNSYGVGDTAVLSPLSMRIYKLDPIDTVYRAVRLVRSGSRKVVINNQVNSLSILRKVSEKSSIDIDRMGWVNCDRFYNTPGTKTDFFVDIKDANYNYYTVMIFDKYKSILSGQNMNESQVLFPNIPLNEPFKIISIGIDKDGKAVYAIKDGTAKGNIITDLQFQPINIPDLKTSLSKLEN